MNYEIVEYNSIYCNEIISLIVRNLMDVNIKDYGIEKMREHASKFTPQTLEEYSKNNKMYVALENGKVVGTLRVDKNNKGNEFDYVLLTIFVLPDCFNRGIGSALVNAGENYVKTLGGKSISIPSSVDACKFYEKLGYYYVNDNNPDEDGVVLMKKDLI